MNNRKPQTTLDKVRKTADYFRDQNGVLWKKVKGGWKRMKDAEVRHDN